MFYLMAQSSDQYPVSPQASVSLLHLLHNPIIPTYHVIPLPPAVYRKCFVLERSLHFQAAQKVCGTILFSLRIQNSVWILILATGGEQPLVEVHVSGAIQQGFAGILL
jgi:hypothetical protein